LIGKFTANLAAASQIEQQVIRGHLSEWKLSQRQNLVTPDQLVSGLEELQSWVESLCDVLTQIKQQVREALLQQQMLPLSKEGIVLLLFFILPIKERLFPFIRLLC
jgi:hypothetical protein